MKILKIELQNINSIKSEQPYCIDFEKPEFIDVGLFAITGSTGAGKTTILDAITIALYHRVPRFNKSNIKAGLVDVVSYGASEALARVTFISQSERFEAQWTLRVKGKSGKTLANPVESVRLKNLSQEKIIGEKKTEVQKAILEITQLNYDQFLRSVMLAQGEFAAFLSANAKDKGNLLEQITGEEIYKKIGNLISDKIYAEKKILDEIKSKINTEDLLTEDDKLKLIEQQTSSEFKNTELDNSIGLIRTQMKWFSKQEELIKQKEIWENNVQKSKVVEKESENDLIKLNKHKNAVIFSSEIKELNRLQKEKEGFLVKIQTLKTDLDFNNKALIRKDKNLKEVQDLFLKSEQEFKTWLPKLEELTKLDNSLENEKKNKTRLETSLLEIRKNLKSEQITLKGFNDTKISQQLKLKEAQKFLKAKQDITKFEQFYSEWNTKLSERKSKLEHRKQQIKKEKQFNIDLELIEKSLTAEHRNLTNQKVKNTEIDKILEKLKSKREKQAIENINRTLLNIESQIFNWQSIQQNWSNWKIKNDSLESIKTEALLSRKAIETLNKTIVNLEQKDQQLKQSLEDALKIYDQAQLIKRYKDDRLKLKPNEPCFICGSESHPLIDQYQNQIIDKDKKRVELRKEEVDKNLLSLQNLITEKKILEQKIENSTKQELELNKELTLLSEYFTTKAVDPKSINALSIEVEVNKLNQSQKDLKVKIDQIEKENLEIDKITQSKEDISLIQIKVEKEIAILNEKDGNIRKQLKDLNQEKENNFTELQTLETSLIESFGPLNISIPSAEMTSSFLHRLKTTIDSFNENKRQADNLKVEIEKNDLEIKSKSEQSKTLEKQSVLHSTQIKDLDIVIQKIYTNRIAILPIETSPEEKRNLLNTSVTKLSNLVKSENEGLQNTKTLLATNQKELDLMVAQISKNKQEFETVQDELSKALSESIFNSIEEVKLVLLSSEMEKELQNKQDLILENQTKLKTKSDELATAFKALEAELNFTESKAELESKLKAFTETKEVLLKELGSIKTKFDQDKRITERNSGVVQDIKKQEKIYHKWSHLMNLLGGSKHAFNTYVQRLTLKNLIDLANIHLYKLNKRYSLKMEETYKTGEELNFKLVDHYQTDMTRFVDTSSGGEKFLISLSLALGLSDLSSKNVQIGSLFIDEGFGTLDQNTLETVISTLETLQAQGKMIGIISHVENLKERISTQIQVIKKSNGVSEIEIH